MGDLLILAANKSDSEHAARFILGTLGFIGIVWILSLIFSKGPKE